MTKELKGERQFEKLTRWNTLEDTIISNKNQNAPYADEVNGNKEKFFLTYFIYKGKVMPFNKFKLLDTAILLDDMSNLIRYDEETGYYLEVNPKTNKIRMWKEIV